jgi:hypothetical protein
MPLLRPARRATDPAGHHWEIYVSAAARWRPSAWRRKDGAPRPVHVEAITFMPCREVLSWTTTSDHVERVIRQVVAAVEAGEVARPLGAVFQGSRAH